MEKKSYLINDDSLRFLRVKLGDEHAAYKALLASADVKVTNSKRVKDIVSKLRVKSCK